MATPEEQLAEINKILDLANVPRTFAGIDNDVVERVRWLFQAVLTNREAFQRQFKLNEERVTAWAKQKAEFTRNRVALGRKLHFIKRATEEAVNAARFFDRHYRGDWGHNRWLQFMRSSFENRAETRCVARCPFDSRQCNRGLGHYGGHESGKCSWLDGCKF